MMHYWMWFPLSLEPAIKIETHPQRVITPPFPPWVPRLPPKGVFILAYQWDSLKFFRGQFSTVYLLEFSGGFLCKEDIAPVTGVPSSNPQSKFGHLEPQNQEFLHWPAKGTAIMSPAQVEKAAKNWHNYLI